jgi:hypothetical protein
LVKAWRGKFVVAFNKTIGLQKEELLRDRPQDVRFQTLFNRGGQGWGIISDINQGEK